MDRSSPIDIESALQNQNEKQNQQFRPVCLEGLGNEAEAAGVSAYRSPTENGREKKVSIRLCGMKGSIGLWLRKLMAEEGNPETESKENKKAAISILACNTAAITTVTTGNGAFGQAVLILSTASFVLSLILTVAPIAMPALSLTKVKRIVLVSAVFLTACSFLGYVAMKMGPISGTAAAAMFFFGGFVFSVIVLFLIPHSQLPLASAPPPGDSQPHLTSAPAPAPFGIETV